MKHHLFLLSGLALFMNLADAEVIVHETFADGRETQNPPQSLAWHAIVPESVTVESNALFLSGAEESLRTVVATFPSVRLNQGDELVLTFDFTVGGEVGYENGALRVGLYSLSSPPAADGENPKTEGTGYLVSFNNASHASGNQTPFTGATFFERIVDGVRNPNPLITSHENHMRLQASGIRPGQYEAGISYSTEFRIQPVSETSVRLLSRTSGGGFSYENDFEATVESEHGQVFTEFDALVLSINASSDDDGGFPQISISNVKLEMIRK